MASSTSCGSLNSRRRSAKRSSPTFAGVLVSPAANRNTNFSVPLNAGLSSKQARSRNWSSEIPAFLPTAE